MANYKTQQKPASEARSYRRGFLRGKVRAPKDTQAKVIDAARKYLQKNTPHTLTFHILEREAQVSRQLIVNEFESINDIVLSAVETLMVRWSKRFVAGVKQIDEPDNPQAIAAIMSETFLSDLEFCRLIGFTGWAMSKQISAKRATKFKVTMLAELWRVSSAVKKKLPRLSRRDIGNWIYPVFSLIAGITSFKGESSVEFKRVSAMRKFSLVHSELDDTIRHGILCIVVGSYSLKNEQISDD